MTNAPFIRSAVTPADNICRESMWQLSIVERFIICVVPTRLELKEMFVNALSLSVPLKPFRCEAASLMMFSVVLLSAVLGKRAN
ncbi:hypothetical protein Y032_0777g2275 [Ancylostoma ceylanicum]|uniref:Uncharacterized protein n=1 Tax=Ancylostoma ceylanicum TaxID=53326 RepID=A0A016WF37_9BILA|nr:hypothetical protein Y032_0777g2275 [Ancylostoma ceylanicum]